MVIVKLMGGLGNQMFQYAAARRLAYINNVPLKLDISLFNSPGGKETTRKYELHSFNIVEGFSSPAEINKFTFGLQKLIPFAKIICLSKYLYVKEKHYHFDPQILKLCPNVYLEGYWQSEKYFEDIKEIIRNEFTFKNDPEGLNQKYAMKLQNCDEDTVSLHFRRGDYCTNPNVNRYHGMCSIDYYQKAIKRIASQVHTPHFMIFSDDPIWVADNFRIDHPFTIVNHNGPHAVEDLRLMSFCKHHIIANSTFSWWGAWLSHNPDKVVIAPQKWFNQTKIYTKDLIPGKWILI